MNLISLPPGAPDQDMLDLGAIPGVRGHHQRTGVIPILVFRKARRIQAILNPFPGVWRASSPAESRCLIVGRNTFPTPIAVQAGDELTITPIMSAVAPTGPRVQVPAELVSDIGELEVYDEIFESAGDESDQEDGPDDHDIDTALGTALALYSLPHAGGAA